MKLREALTLLYSCAPKRYSQLFLKYDFPTDEINSNSFEDENSKSFEDSLNLLSDLGILKYINDKLHSSFLIARLTSGFFYISDRTIGHKNEVFSMHYEQQALLFALQARGGDQLLDLCTGNGILLIEAVRHGGRGIGIDINHRALEFARANAAINEVADRTTFLAGDVTSSAGITDWGTPNLVLANPPFEPLPEGASLPRHSDGGFGGVKVIEPMFETLGRWKHRPELIQLVLFSFFTFYRPSESGRDTTASESGEPLDRLSVGTLLQNLRSLTGLQLEVKETGPGLGLRDLCALRHPSAGPDLANRWAPVLVRQPWATGARSADDIGVRLLLANLLKPHVETKSVGPIYISWSQVRQGEECIVAPLAAQESGSIGQAMTTYLADLTYFREKENQGKTIELHLDDPHIQNFLIQMLRSESLLGSHCHAIVLDIRPRHGSLDFRAVKVTPTSPVRGNRIYTSANDLNSQISKWDFASVTVCDVFAQPPFISLGTLSGTPAEVIALLLKANGELQRFAVLSRWPAAALYPVRQIAFANLLSELCFQAQTFQDLAYEVAHELKNRTSDLAILSEDVAKLLERPDLNFKRIRPMLRAIAAHGLQLNAISLAMQELTRPTANGDLYDFIHNFEPSMLLHAAARLMLELRSQVEPRIKIREGMTLDKAREILEKISRLPAQRTRRSLSDLCGDENVALLCLVVAEPIKNIRPIQPTEEDNEPISVWIESAAGSPTVLVYQETVEPLHTNFEPIRSTGVTLTNHLLRRTMFWIDPDILVDGKALPWPDNRASSKVLVKRYAKILISPEQQGESR